MKGFSPRHLKHMRAFADAWPVAAFVQQAAARLPWFHLRMQIDRLKTRGLRDWYLAQAVTKFAERLPAPRFQIPAAPSALREHAVAANCRA